MAKKIGRKFDWNRKSTQTRRFFVNQPKKKYEKI